ncbi:hypothetical protein OIO90_003165 [Microbotryomycetes sp. JL221]|nr:hypothetical protein OIO90_003165 [Microbotryomycetes sp. JL221]
MDLHTTIDSLRLRTALDGIKIELDEVRTALSGSAELSTQVCALRNEIKMAREEMATRDQRIINDIKTSINASLSCTLEPIVESLETVKHQIGGTNAALTKNTLDSATLCNRNFVSIKMTMQEIASDVVTSLKPEFTSIGTRLDGVVARIEAELKQSYGSAGQQRDTDTLRNARNRQATIPRLDPIPLPRSSQAPEHHAAAAVGKPHDTLPEGAHQLAFRRPTIHKQSEGRESSSEMTGGSKRSREASDTQCPRFVRNSAMHSTLNTDDTVCQAAATRVQIHQRPIKARRVILQDEDDFELDEADRA